MHRFKNVSCALMAGALTISAFAAAGCRKVEETSKESTTVSTVATTVADSSETDPGIRTDSSSEDPSDSSAEDSSREPQDPVEKQAKSLAAELNVDESELHGKYELFIKYADCVVNNPKLGEWRAYALHMFPVVADHLAPENEEYFLGKVKDLKMESLYLSDAAGEFIALNNGIRIFGDGIVYNTEATYSTVFHELTHFVDATIHGEDEPDVYYTGKRFTYQDDYTDEEWQYASEHVSHCYSTNFITEGGAELYAGKYFTKAPRSYYCENSFLTGLEWIYGSEKLDELFFGNDSSMQFIQLLKDAGYTDEQICVVLDSFNYYTYSRGNRPDKLVRYEDVLIDLYTQVKGNDWKKDKVFSQILWQIKNAFYYDVDLQHSDVTYSDLWQFSDSITGSVDQGDNPKPLDILTVVILDGKPYLTCGLERFDTYSPDRASTLIIDLDFDTTEVLSYEYFTHPFPETVPNPLPSGAALDAKLESFARDNSAAHQQVVYVGSPEWKEVYERAAQIGNKYGIFLYVGENIPSYITCSQLPSSVKNLKTALDKVEKILERFPEDYFDQFAYGNYAGFEIALVDRPLWNELMVYTTENGYVLNCALECRDETELKELESRLLDAIYSATDLKIKYYFENIEDPDFSEEIWKTYNPESSPYFGYLNSNDEKDTYNAYKDYFVSMTAMRNAPKDRSQLMTAILEGRDLSAPCIKKAEYYSRMIREAFDDSSWSEKTSWEEEISRQNGKT